MRDSTWEVGVLGRARSRFPAVPVLLLAASIVGCGSDASTSPASVGTVSGQVLDENEVGVEGASLTLSRPGFPERQTASGEDGTFTFPEVEAGVWELRVDPPAGLEPAPGQEEVFEVPVTANRTATLIVSLRRMPASGWELLAGSPTPPDGHTRHEDIHFLDAERGWLVNTSGRIYRTRDGGATWDLQREDPSFLFRSVAFATPERGWVGSLNRFRNPDPGAALFETRDGGATWQNITDRAAGPEPVGVCGIWVQDEEVVYAVGRWHGPAIFLRTRDGGQSWESFDLSPLVTGLVDVYFFDRDRGIVVGGRGVGPEIEEQQASVTVVLGTEDGGDTWDVLYESAATGKWAWKISFPTADVGYIATQGPTADGVVLKTTDGGRGWEELVVNDGLGFSGIGFATPDLGWVGGGGTTWKTTDGGATWREVALDPVLNGFRMMGPALGFAVGSRVYRYTGGNEDGS